MSKTRWTTEEIVILCAVFLKHPFSSGDDNSPVNSQIAQIFSRSPATIDRQWRNIKDYLAGNPTERVGQEVKQWADILVRNPDVVKRLAVYYCQKRGYELP